MIHTYAKNQANQVEPCISGVSVLQKVTLEGFQDLNKDEFKSYDELKKILNESLNLINKITNVTEAKKIIKSLKNGKSPGLDRFSNEMIKHFFEFPKNC